MCSPAAQPAAPPHNMSEERDDEMDDEKKRVGVGGEPRLESAGEGAKGSGRGEERLLKFSAGW
jgi:hypothetical protein